MTDPVVRTMPGANGGTLQRGNPTGRARKSLRRLQIEAQKDLAKALELARKMIEAGPGDCPHCGRGPIAPKDRVDAMEFIRRCSGIDKQKPRQGKGPTITVMRATEAELLEGAPEGSGAVSETKSGAGAPPKRKERYRRAAALF